MTEAQIQKAVFAHIKTRGAPGAFAWHPFSGGYRRPAEAAIYKGMGAIPGLPDVMVLYQGHLFCIELKVERGHPTAAQLAVIDAIRNAGGYAVVCKGLDAAIDCLEQWKILRGQAA